MKMKDIAGREISIDTEAAKEKAAEYLNNRFPAGWGKGSLRRALKALERQAAKKEIGALEREFA